MQCVPGVSTHPYEYLRILKDEVDAVEKDDNTFLTGYIFNGTRGRVTAFKGEVRLSLNVSPLVAEDILGEGAGTGEDDLAKAREQWRIRKTWFSKPGSRFGEAESELDGFESCCRDATSKFINDINV